MTVEEVVTLVVSLFVVAAGGLIGLKVTAALFRHKSYTPLNATELLHLGRPEEWNEVRILYPEWRPDLGSASLHGMFLPGINLRDALLDDAILSECNLEAANFDRASLKNADLSHASLSDATFVCADLRGAALDGANILGASFRDANLEDTKVRDNMPDPSKQEGLRSAYEPGRGSLYEISPRELEYRLMEVFHRQGFDQVDLTADRQDGGYDIHLQRADPLLGKQTYLVEVKRYKRDRKVDISPVRSLLGVVLANDAERGILVTTSSFSKAALDFAEKSERLNLIDGVELEKMLLAQET